VVSDFFRNNGHGFMNADTALANGVDAMLSTFEGGPNQVTDKSAASNVKYMREATHNILFTTANSWTYDEEHQQSSVQGWQMTAYVIDAVVVIAVAALSVLAWRKYKKTEDRS
jgi:beta-glucosidase